MKYRSETELGTELWYPFYSGGNLYLNSIRRDRGYYLRQGKYVETKKLYLTKQAALIECSYRNRAIKNNNQLGLELKLEREVNDDSERANEVNE